MRPNFQYIVSLHKNYYHYWDQGDDSLVSSLWKHEDLVLNIGANEVTMWTCVLSMWNTETGGSLGLAGQPIYLDQLQVQ